MEILLNIQKDIFKDFLLKMELMTCKFTTQCKGFSIDQKTKNIFFLYKYYEKSIRELILEPHVSCSNKEYRDVLFKQILEIILFFHSQHIFSLNLVFDNIKITRKNTMKIVSLKNAYFTNSNDEFINQVYSSYHFSNMDNVKINFPPQFYNCNSRLISKFYVPNECESICSNNSSFNCKKDTQLLLNNKCSWTIDIWSLGVLLSFIYSDKVADYNAFYFNNNNTFDQETKLNNSIYIDQQYNIYDLYYSRQKILPENLFTNINLKENIIKSFIVGILRYNASERPNVFEIIKNYNIYISRLKNAQISEQIQVKQEQFKDEFFS